MKTIEAKRDGPTYNRPQLLSAQEVEALCQRWHEHHNVAAAGRLIGDYLHLVARVAMAHRGHGVSTQELVGEGYVGLMRAACRYDPACGTKFATYAAWWVQAVIQQSILGAASSMQGDVADFESVTAMPALYAHGSGQRASVQFVS